MICTNLTTSIAQNVKPPEEFFAGGRRACHSQRRCVFYLQRSSCPGRTRGLRPGLFCRSEGISFQSPNFGDQIGESLLIGLLPDGIAIGIGHTDFAAIDREGVKSNLRIAAQIAHMSDSMLSRFRFDSRRIKFCNLDIVFVIFHFYPLVFLFFDHEMIIPSVGLFVNSKNKLFFGLLYAEGETVALAIAMGGSEGVGRIIFF